MCKLCVCGIATTLHRYMNLLYLVFFLQYCCKAGNRLSDHYLNTIILKPCGNLVIPALQQCTILPRLASLSMNLAVYQVSRDSYTNRLHIGNCYCRVEKFSC